MKMLKKCGICHNHYHVNRHHCPTCAAMPVFVNGHVRHIDATNGYQLVRGIPTPISRLLANATHAVGA